MALRVSNRKREKRRKEKGEWFVLTVLTEKTVNKQSPRVVLVTTLEEEEEEEEERWWWWWLFLKLSRSQEGGKGHGSRVI